MAQLAQDWDRIVLQEYGKGASDEEVAFALRITMRRFRDLYSTDNVFMEAVDTGRDWAKAYWMKIGRDNLNDKSFNGPLWYNNMKNRWGWSDKSEISDKTANAQDADQLRKQVGEMLARIKSKDVSKDGVE